jgi:hypothetical protein
MWKEKRTVRQIYKMPLSQILYQIKRADETKRLMENMLVERAARQECLEIRYNELVTLAGMGIDFLRTVQEGETLTTEWVEESHRLAASALHLIEHGALPQADNPT